jgi:tRNA modification GTPase
VDCPERATRELFTQELASLRTAAQALNDTIAAIATPPGPGGIGIIRLSGPGCLTILVQLTGVPKERFSPRRLRAVAFRTLEGRLLDSGLAVWMPAPHSYTGEEVVELHGHGAPFLLQSLLEASLSLGARLAHPGEFTRRAYENGRITLLQAEALAAMIQAGSVEAAQSALSQLDGELSRRLDSLGHRLQGALADVEAAIDFPDEVVMDDGRLHQQLNGSLILLDDIVSAAGRNDSGQGLPQIVIAGRPNVGKSSLFNALLGRERAIVTAIPGTTRDVLEADSELGRKRLRLVDTAGLGSARDELERKGMERARRSLESAGGIIWVVDLSRSPTGTDRLGLKELAGDHTLVVGNKRDLGEDPGWDRFPVELACRLSALTGEGLESLILLIQQRFLKDSVPAWVLDLRQREALAVSRETLATVSTDVCVIPPELLAAQLKSILASLREIAGKEADEAMLDEVFSRFCLGK